MPDPTAFSGRPASSGPRSALLALLLIAAFIGLAIAKPWDRPDPSPSATPTSTAVAEQTAPAPVLSLTPAIAPSPPPSVAIGEFTLGPPPARGAPWTAMTWQAFDPVNALAHLGTVVRWAGGYASVGDDGLGGSVLWTSPDGAAWSPVGSGTADTFWPGIQVRAVAALGRRLIAITSIQGLTSSSEPSTPEPGGVMAWASPNGTAWTPVGGATFPVPLGLTGRPLLAGSNDHLVFAWNEAPDPGAAGVARIAVTADGVRWRGLAPSVLPTGFGISALAAAPGGGFIAAGRTLQDGAATAEILRSNAAGTVWVSVALPDDPALATGERANVVWSLVSGASGVLALGDNPGRELWWWSADGRRWSVVPDFAPIGTSACRPPVPGCGAYPNGMLVGDGERVVAIRVGLDPAVWSSTDGLRWLPISSTGLSTRLPTTSTALLPGGVVLVDNTGAWYGAAATTSP